ncbi:MAG: Smr/MutS family protein, partial [Gammaproteobacteria bacterium]
SDRIHPRPNPPRPEPRFTRADEQMALAESLVTAPDLFELETGEELTWLRPGVQKGVLRRLRRGQVPPERHLDLHGLTVDAAAAQVAGFLRAASGEVRCVRIVHGKGKGSGPRGPVLKTRVAHWLRRRDEVLAFCSAPRHDGGTGAVYVLLRNRVHQQ